jgi:hypothetical protein
MILALVLALATAATLKLIATPSNYADRLAAVEQKALRAERLAALPGDGSAYPKGAVCEGINGTAFDNVRQKLDVAAAAEGLAPMPVLWGAPIDAGGRIAPLPFTLQVEGPYEKVAALLDRLSRSTPAIFVETTDLTAAGPGARLALSGKVYCWTRG